jgi:hypothetical protein
VICAIKQKKGAPNLTTLTRLGLIMDSSCPPILRLPRDLLSDILLLALRIDPCHLFHLFPAAFEPSKSTKASAQALYNLFNTIAGSETAVNESPLLAIRSTCRSFRRIADEFAFWMSDKFAFTNMMDTLFVKTEFLEALLSDPHLQQCLSRKTGWSAESPPVFEVFARKIPQFGQHVRYLRLCNIGDHADSSWGGWTAIPETVRDTFPVLTELKIKSDTHVHLDVFPTSLRKLVYEAARTAKEDWYCDCRNTLPNLEYLKFNQYRRPVDLERMLPFDSKDSLRELVFKFPAGFVMGKKIPKWTLLHQFENLTTLRTTYHSTEAIVELYRSLQQAPFRLQTLETMTADRTPIVARALVDLLQSPVLHNLRHLKFSFDGHEGLHIDEAPIYEPLIQAIANLPVLESLVQYRVPLHVDWLQHFRNSRYLTSVKWKYHAFGPVDVVGEYAARDMKAVLKAVLGYEIPSLKICFKEYDDMDEFWSDYDGPEDGEDGSDAGEEYGSEGDGSDSE